MTRCDFCGYLYQQGSTREQPAEGVCAVCAARTTRVIRQSYQRGERSGHSYMDSD